MRAYLTQLPDYVCRVNIERYRGTAKKNLPLQDRVRLEVAFVGGRELYAMPGDNAFGQRSLRQISGAGAMYTGSYAQQLREIFLTGHPEFSAVAAAVRDGQRHVRIDFRVPQDNSMLEINETGMSARVGYSGTVLLDPASLEIEELELDIAAVPQKMNMASAHAVTVYHRVRIGDRDVRLARSGELTLSTRDGTFARNSVRFENCRRYGVESNISFDAPASAAATAAAPAAAPLTLRPHTTITLALESTVDDQSAIGDPVTFRVAEKNKALPKGSLVKGHITRMGRQRDGRGRNWRLLAVRLEVVEAEGRRGEFLGELMGIAMGMAPSVRDSFRVAEPETPLLPGEGAVVIAEREFPPGRGLRMYWVTQ